MSAASSSEQAVFPAPTHVELDGDQWGCGKGAISCDGGLTKRELIAAMAMQGMLAHEHWRGGSASGRHRKDLADESVRCADELLAALSGTHKSAGGGE